MPSITTEQFIQLHSLEVDATTKPSLSDLAEWINWAEGKILSYLQIDDLPTDKGSILKNIADDLLFRKWIIEKLSGTVSPQELINIAQPQLTPENKMDLDSLKGQDTSIEPTTFNFDLTKTEGGFEY